MLQGFVQRFRPARDSGPAEVFLSTFASSFSEFFAQSRIGHKLIDLCREITGKLVRVYRHEWALLHLLQRNEKTRFSVNDYFLNAANGACDNGSFACHRFQINYSKRLVNRRTAEHGGV